MQRFTYTHDTSTVRVPTFAEVPRDASTSVFVGCKVCCEVTKGDPWRVEVEWHDSTLLYGGWEDIPAALKRRKAVRCRSVGFVLADDKHGLVLAASVHGGQAAGITIIPRGQVVNVRRMSPKGA